MEENRNIYILKGLVEQTLSLNLDSEWIDATLFVPYQTEQTLLYEYADCLATRTFLKEFMSPTGTVPLLKLQNVLVSDFGPVVDFVGKKGLKLASTLTESEKSDLQAFISLIEENLRNAEASRLTDIEIFISWRDNETYKQVTKPRYQSVYLFPLHLWLPWVKRRQMITYLESIGWTDKSITDVVNLCDRTFRILSVRLGNHRYFIGDQPTELDALAFGHLYTLLTTELPSADIAETLKKYQNLIDFCKRIDEEFFAT